MQESMENNKMHYLVALLLGVVGLLVILIFVSIRSQAEDASKPASVSITNSAPTVNSVTVALSSGAAQSDITLSDNSEVTAFVHGQYQDNNGCHEVENGTLEVALYGPASSQSGCDSTSEADLDDCYYSSYTVAGGVVSGDVGGADSCTLDLNTGCTAAGDTTVTANYECEWTGELVHFMDPGTWTAAVRVTDSNSATSSWNTDTTFSVGTLAAISVDTASVDYGTLGLGEVSSDKTVTISNTGNKENLDVDIAATLMNCTIGDFTAGDGLGIAAQHYDLASTTFGSMTSASSTQTAVGTSIMRQETTAGSAAGSNPSDDIHFKLKVPSTAVSGNCSSTLSFYAD